MSHTQGKLNIDEFGGVICGDGQRLLLDGVAINTGHRDKNAAANARRLVACWNLLEGIATVEFEGKSLAEYVTDQAFLSSFNVTNGALDIQMQGGACSILAASFAGQFKGSGATNFLELSFKHQEIGEFTVTMQRKQGETPSQQTAKIKAQRDELLRELTNATPPHPGCGSTVGECVASNSCGCSMGAAIAKVKGEKL